VAHPETPAERAATLVALEAEVIACRRCPRLVAWREQVAREKVARFRDEPYWGRPLPGFGDEAARIVLVGLAPAAHGGNRTGRVFTGDASGDVLWAALHDVGLANRASSRRADDGLALADVRITAAVRCAPPLNKPTIEERDACRPYLERELALLDARVFVPLGAFAYQGLCAVLGVRPRPPFRHGVEVELPESRWIIGSFHVSQQNTFTGKLTEPMLDAVFTRARALAGL
jgi:uracil-DNA glycosylase family 4